jgi:prevent-host-death family protein
MTIRLTASRLRQDIYQVLDKVLDTGEPVEIVRRGRRLRIIAVTEPAAMDTLPERPDFIVGDPEDLVQLDWSGEWQP